MSKNIIFLLLIGVGLLTFSCKKEYVSYPYNAIESFTIRDSTGAPLKAVLENGNVIVYWPPFQTVPDSITPQIVLSDRATIVPASGKKVPFNSSVTYIVTAQDGSSRKYTLKPAINQPLLTGLDFYLPENVGGSLSIGGEYFIPDMTVTKLFLVSQQNKETRIWGSSFTQFTSSSVYVEKTPLSLDTGFYKIKFINGTQTVTSGSFHMAPPFLRNEEISFPDQGKTLKPGDVLTLNFISGGLTTKYYINNIANIILGFSNTDIPYFTIPVNSQNANGAKFTIPADCPAGTIVTILIQTKAGPYAGSMNFSSGQEITISN